MPARPSITPVFSCGLIFWAACAAAMAAGRTQIPSSCLVYAVLSCALALLALCVSLGLRKPAVLTLAALAAGAAIGFSHANALHVAAETAPETIRGAATLRLLEDSQDNGYGERALAEVQCGSFRCTASVRIDGGQELLFGTVVNASVSAKPVDFADDAYSWGDGAVCSLEARNCKQADVSGIPGALLGIRSRAIRSFDGSTAEGALLKALVCGYRRDIRSSESYGAYQTCGLAHLVAVSGAHLVIVTGFFASMLRALKVPRRVSSALLIALMCSYLVVSGMPVSAIRACIMSSVGVLAFLGRRRPSSQNALGIGIFAIVCANPCASLSVSFALSALSTAGIVLLAPFFQWHLQSIPLMRSALICEPLSLTLSASIASQLYACSLFNMLPLISGYANIACAPLFPLACGSGLAGALASMMAPPASQIVIAPANFFASALDRIVVALSGAPYASVPISIGSIVALGLSALCVFAIWLLWSRLRLAHMAYALVLALCLVSAFNAYLSSGDRIVMLDVGQGDSFLVSSCGTTLLVDTGNKDGQLIGQLARCGATHLDCVLVTHSDDDHCGSLDALEKAVDVTRVYVSEGTLSCPCENCRALVSQAQRTAREVSGVRYHDAFDVGRFHARVIWPRAFGDEGGNADSICLEITYDADSDGTPESRALFTGDAESAQLKSIVEAGDVSSVDVLKVGHHGSKNGSTQVLMDVLDPAIALIGVGADNRYGHPAPETLEQLEAVGCEVFRSDTCGQTSLTFSADTIRIRSEKGP